MIVKIEIATKKRYAVDSRYDTWPRWNHRMFELTFAGRSDKAAAKIADAEMAQASAKIAQAFNAARI